MALRLRIHRTTPQQRLITQAAQIILRDGLLAMPTDARYVLVCAVNSHSAQQRLRQVCALDEDHLLSLICANLGQVAEYALVDNEAFRVLKSCLPGAYTLVLKGSKELGKKIGHPKRKTVGVRIPQHEVVQALIHTLGTPLVAASLDDGNGIAYTEVAEIERHVGNRIDAIIDTDETHALETTVLDLTTDPFSVIREGIAPIPWGS
jgi:tRNA threonylcarbamoyl adenosine modification protein (Sua5/YciO/YrdC/YwlC family)